MDIYTETTVGNKIITDSIRMISTLDVVLAYAGDEEAKKRIKDTVKRNEEITKLKNKPLP